MLHEGRYGARLRPLLSAVIAPANAKDKPPVTAAFDADAVGPVKVIKP